MGLRLPEFKQRDAATARRYLLPFRSQIEGVGGKPRVTVPWTLLACGSQSAGSKTTDGRTRQPADLIRTVASAMVCRLLG